MLIGLFGAAACILLVSVSALWPRPRYFEYGSTVLWLSSSFEIKYNPEKDDFRRVVQKFLGHDLAMSEPDSTFRHNKLVDAAVKRLYADVRTKSFVPWKFHPKASLHEPKPDDNIAVIRTIEICRVKRPKLDISDEAYSLYVNDDGQVNVRAHADIGVLRALTSLTQLFYKHSSSSERIYMNTAPVIIKDEPYFKHRGLNVDISRNVITPNDIMRTIDAMIMNKFNRLHLHASDAQSWPLEIPSITSLALQGAYHESQIWSAADLRRVQRFGKLRGLEVYIEIDMPGHTASIQESHSELIESFNRKPWEEFSAQPPSGQLKLDDQGTRDFVTTLLNDLLPRLKSFSSLFHLGGDEITAAAYNMTVSEVQPYLQEFVDHAISLLHSYGFTPVIWEELLLDYNLTLPANTLVQAWRGTRLHHRSALAEIVGKGHEAIFGQNDHWYLDCGHGAWIDRDVNNSESPIKSPYLDYCSPYKNWREVLSYEPLVDVPMTQRHLVIGGEVSLWGEQTDSMNLDSSLWPRVAAAAEVLWSGKGTIGEDATRRLAEMREWLVSKGVASAPVQVTWCLMHPGNCIL